MRYVNSEGVSLHQLTMPLDETSESARPYRCGMVLLCMGALINWLGFAQTYEHPVRYIGIACIIGGAVLIAGAVCCWAKDPDADGETSSDSQQDHTIDGVHVIQIADEGFSCKPPDYESLAESSPPPTYDEAIKLSPAHLQLDSVQGKV